MIYVLDNYDSFTYNLVHAVGSLGVEIMVGRNDHVSADDILNLNPEAVILSPGPGRPESAGNMGEIVRWICDKLPILGVCLGHQMLAVHFGAQLRKARTIVHGKASSIFHDGRGIFTGIENPIQAGRYHSLAVDESTLPGCLEISARTSDGEIMALRHRSLPVQAVQFHPESVLSPSGNQLLSNFIALCRRARSRKEVIRV